MTRTAEHNQPNRARLTGALRTRGLGSRLAAALLISSCGCAQTSKWNSSSPALIGAPQSNHAAVNSTKSPIAAQSASRSQHQSLSDRTVPSMPVGDVAKTTPNNNSSSPVQPVSYTEQQAAPAAAVSDDQLAPVVPASHALRSNVAGAGCNPNDGCNYCAGPTTCAVPDPAAAPTYWNDQEYLYDGGDRGDRARVDLDWSVKGLDSQDTIAHYETLDGKVCVTPTNRVPVYAPRFAAVRKVTGLIAASRAVGAERILEPNGPAVKRTNDLAGNVAHPVGPNSKDGVKLIDGFHDRNKGVAAEGRMPIVGISNLAQAFQNIEAIKLGLRRDDLPPALGKYLQNAQAWVNPESLSVMLEGKEAIQLRDTKGPQDVHVYEMEPGKCSLRICKAASHAVASPGDEINFVIRFDNVGVKPIGNLVILDSLTTRLEYIDRSQQCVLSIASAKGDSNRSDIKVNFSITENEAGSTVLRWEADTPLDTGDSGVISFRCRVR